MAFKEPLYLPVHEREDHSEQNSQETLTTTRMTSDSIREEVSKADGTDLNCLLCEEVFQQSSEILRHLLESHSFVIEDPESIASLPAYFKYWKERFKAAELSWFCATIETTENKKFHMLTKTLPEDCKLREELARKRQERLLKPVLEQKQRERSDESTTRTCLFCRKSFRGKSHELFQHMFLDHNFNVGRADNLVFIDEFLALLGEKLEKLVCLYCEKTFKNWEVLKEHMRKKQHKHLNPTNTIYDKFYIVSYLSNEEKLKKEKDEEFPRSADRAEDEDDDAFEDWSEEHKFEFVCLFCEHSTASQEELFNHMKCSHSFDFSRERCGLGFYDQVKIVNYIRRQTHVNVCYRCGKQMSDKQEMLRHIESSHGEEDSVLEKSQWDQPVYYFPTYENDQLLLALEDNHEETNEEWVLPEDIVRPDAKLLQELSLNDGDDGL